MNNSSKKCEPETAMKVLKIIGMVLLGIAACFLFGLVIQLLWNWLMPAIFGLTEITYWQGIGILALSSILFGRLGGGSSGEKNKEKGRNPIKEEIKKEIAKEFEKEFGENANKDANLEYEEMYEKWWEAEGKDCFEKYSKRCMDNE